jgi:hypothetical protein
MTQQYVPTLTGNNTDYLDGNGAFSPLLDPTQFTFFFDDFINAVRNTTNLSGFETGGTNLNWGVAFLGAAANASLVVPADSGCIGSVILTSGNAASGNYAFIAATEIVTASTMTSLMCPMNDKTFDCKFRVAIPNTTSVRVYAGLVDNNAAAGDGMYIRYDTSLSDTTWTAVTADGSGANTQTITGSVLDANYHTLRIRSTTAGTILFSVDGGTEISSATHITSNTIVPIVQVMTKTTAARTFKCDYVWGWIKLAR